MVHAVDDEAPEYVPEAQLRQVDATVWLAAEEYLPAAQFVQFD